VLYADEVDIHLNPKIGCDWMLPGHQRRVVTPGKNEKFYLAGALDVRTGRLETVGDFRKDSNLFGQLLFRLAARYRTARMVHVVLDNYCIHRSTLVKRILAELGGKIVLHFLPPYCPDHNRIERVWLDLHANVTRNHRCKSMRQLLANVRAFLSNYRWSRVAKTHRLPLRAAA
jgi:transposase